MRDLGAIQKHNQTRNTRESQNLASSLFISDFFAELQIWLRNWPLLALNLLPFRSVMMPFVRTVIV
jgi:hypothetical protein